MQKKTTELSFSFFYAVFKKRLVWLILAVVIGAGLAFGYSKLLCAPEYSSTAEFIVRNTSNSSSQLASGYQQGVEMMAGNYVREINGSIFLEKMATEYNARSGKSLTSAQISRRVKASIVNDTATFQVKVTGETPQSTLDLLRVFEDYGVQLLNEDQVLESIRVDLISRGNLPHSPDSPNLTLNMAVGAVLLLIAVYLVFFLIAFFDRTIYNEEVVRSHFKEPILGVIPQWNNGTNKDENFRLLKGPYKRPYKRLKTGAMPEDIVRDYRGRLLSTDTPFSVSESFKAFRTNLAYVPVAGEGAPVFGVTSDFPGAGKSFFFANVTISFAQLGKKVLLIDGDMRCPAQSRLFPDVENHIGLSEALAGIAENPLDSCVVKNVREGVDLMPSGHIPPNPAELLCSDRMKELIAQVRQKYDYVFIDLPPILETADAGVLASVISGYVLLIRVCHSNIDSLHAALEALRQLHANVVGLVLNGVIAKSGYGYGHGYGYGYGNTHSLHRQANKKAHRRNQQNENDKF